MKVRFHEDFGTGGAGFIGAAVDDYVLRETSDEVTVLDKLTYAGETASPRAVKQPTSRN